VSRFLSPPIVFDEDLVNAFTVGTTTHSVWQ